MPREVKRSVSRTVKNIPSRRSRPNSRLPTFIRPQLSEPVEKPPSGPQWLHEIKLDGYRMAARIDNGRVQLLTRTGLDWTDKYPSAVAALANLNIKTAYFDGELCGVDEAGLPTFAHTQAATDGEARCGSSTTVSIFCISMVGTSRTFSSSSAKRFWNRCSQTSRVFSSMAMTPATANSSSSTPASLDLRAWCPRRSTPPYAPGNRGLWRKAKWLNRQEFIIVGWSDPEGSRPHLGALLLSYYTNDGKLTYAGRVGTGMPVKVLADLRQRLDPLARRSSPLYVPPSRKTRFGSPLVLSRIHWVEPVLVAEITYLTWTADNLLRHTVYTGLREDKPADQVRREVARS